MLSSLDSKLLDSAFNLSVKVKVGDIKREFDGKAKAVIEFFKKYMPTKAVTISDDYLAGVIVHDEWSRKDGIRSIFLFITFEAEASSDGAAWKLIDTGSNAGAGGTRERDGWGNKTS